MKISRIAGVSVVVALLAVMCVSSGCGGSEEGSTSGDGSTGVIKIGILQPLTGDAAAWGLPIVRSAELAAKNINDAGGVEVGGKTYTIELVEADSAADPTKALTAANKLVFEDGVKFINGPMTSAELAVVEPFFEENQVIALSCCSAASSSSGSFQFNGYPTGDAYNSATWTATVQAFPELKTVAMVFGDDAASRENNEIELKIAEYLGLSVVSQEAYDPATQDFSAVLTKVLAKNPDLITTGIAGPGSSALIIKQARELGYEGKFVCSSGSDPNVLLDTAGEGANGTVYLSMTDYLNFPEATPLMKDVAQQYIDTYGKMDAFGAEFYDYTLQIVAGIEAADSTDPVKVAEAFADPGFSWEGVWGTTNWCGEEFYGRNIMPDSGVGVSMIQDGRDQALGGPTYEDIQPVMAAWKAPYQE